MLRKKYFFAVVLCIAIVIGIMPSASAITTPVVTIGNESGKPGDIVRVPVSIINSPGFIGFHLTISIDTKYLNLIDIEESTILKDRVSYSYNGNSQFINYRYPDKYSTIKVEDKVTKEGVLFYLKIEILENINGQITVPIELKNGYLVVVNSISKDSNVLYGMNSTLSRQNGFVSINGAPVIIGENKKRFGDLTGEYTSYTEYVEYLAEKGIIGGVGDGKFAPEKNVKRGDFVKMLAGVSEVDFSGDEYTTDKFTDVPKTHSYNKLIGWASSAGIVTGYGDKTFKMDNSITREDMAVMIYRLSKYMNVLLPIWVDEAVFIDQEMISAYAKDAVWELQLAGIIDGNEFKPKVPATRADAAKMLALYMKVYD